MPSILIALVVSVVMFLGIVKMSKVISPDKGDERTKKAMRDLRSSADDFEEDEVSIIKAESENPVLEKICHSIPTMGGLYDLSEQSGMSVGIGFWVIVEIILGIVFFVVFNFFLEPIGIAGMILAVPIAIVLALWLPRRQLKGKIADRNVKFLNLFPDALDMIVRSVKSGHPINASIQMVIENIGEPVKDEFKQVMDEVEYGRTLPEALGKMGERIQESDVAFFVVVVTVQQETGGNLAEVLSNLSNVIRQRKMMRLRIKAMTAEARMTMWLLAGIPVLFGAGMFMMAYGYMSVLLVGFGRFVLAAAIFLIFLTVFVVNWMMKIDI